MTYLLYGISYWLCGLVIIAVFLWPELVMIVLVARLLIRG